MLKNKWGFVIKSIFICFVILLSTITAADCPRADISGDCIVDMDDLIILASDWLSTDLPTHPNLIARWRLNETSGEIAYDDINGYDGQLYGDPQWMPLEGYRQGALFFDGQDDYVQMTGYKGISGTASRTCAAWISTTQVSEEILTWGSEAGNGARWIIRVNQGGELRAEVQGGNIIGSTFINDGDWHHVAVVSEANADIKDAKLYVDGYLERISAYVDEPINTGADQDVQIGLHSVALRFFNGKIDDVRIYNTALSGSDIFNLYATGTALHDNVDINADDYVGIEDYGFISQEWQIQKPSVIISEFLTDNDSDDPPVVEEGQLLDGNGDSSDWIELHNQTDYPVSLSGWSLTDDQTELDQWTFPSNAVIPEQGYLIVFASGKKQSDNPGNYPYIDSKGYFHINFKLSDDGEYLALVRPDGTIEHAYDSVLNSDSQDYGYPEQEENISYGTLYDEEYFFGIPTPGTENREHFYDFVDAPDFSHERGFYDSSFSLMLTTETPDAIIRYTTDGTDPGVTNGLTYTEPIEISAPSTSTAYEIIRAMAYKPGYEPSRIKSKTYVINPSNAMKGLPALCLSGSPTETFFNPNGVMAIVGGAWGGNGWYKISASDYNNVLGHGMDYERPVSVEYINPEQQEDFQEDCGLRVNGSIWMRPRYLPATSGIWYGDGKYSLRLCFRGQYGDTYFRHSIFEQFPEMDKMDSMVLRAGHNDRDNPFVRDEMIRRLQYYMGHSASLGTFVNLFINGSYKGYYNLCERLNEEFCQKNFDSDLQWDVVGWVTNGSTSYLEARDGDAIAFQQLIDYARNNDLTNAVHYNYVANQLDLEAFVDYVILQSWGGNWDWPHNNWTATAERSENRKWRFFVWDAEGCMDNSLDRNRLGDLYYGSHPLSYLYRALWANDDFKMLFADRMQKHFYENDSVMNEAFLDALFWQLADEVKGVIPSINTYVPNTYIPNRNSIFISQCRNWDLFTFEGPQFLIDGKSVSKTAEGAEGSLLSLWGYNDGNIYYTLNGTDPRVPVSQPSVTYTLVQESAAKKVLIPTSNIGTSWKNINYNDTSWDAGTPADSSKAGGVGYERSSGYEDDISYDIGNDLYDQYTSVYIRIPFAIDSLDEDMNFMNLEIGYDDAFVAYINGVEVCRRGFSGTPAWNSYASSDHEYYTKDVISIAESIPLLQVGKNVLAIHGMNVGTRSSDFIISPVLVMGYNPGVSAISPSAQRYTSPVVLQKSCKIKARILSGGQWSALRQIDVVVGPVNENLRISEIMYNPNSDPNEEFIELTNIGTDPINLNYSSFTEGINYTFGDVTLLPDEYVLLVRNQPIFESKYGTELPVLGEYEGALNDAGENITLCNAVGNRIQSIDFKDGWYEITDGDGFSLNVANMDLDQTVVPSNNLLLHWKFDESDGIEVEDSANSNHGFIYNMLDKERVPGIKGDTLLFDGIDDYVSASDYRGVSGTASRTCSAWIKTTRNIGEIITWGSEAGDGARWIIRVNQDGQLRAEVQGGYIIGTTLINDGLWHHVAVVLENDGSPNIIEAKLYVDGNLDTISASLDEPVNTGSVQNVRVGSYFVSQRYFEGCIDDVCIYNRALSQQEIMLLKQYTNTWDEKDLWRPSSIRGGTPGRAETQSEQVSLPGSVVINEVLSHSHAELPDWIELHNTTGQDINIGGWFLSDTFGLTDADRMKYQIPAGVILTAANPYYVIEESRFNNISDPGCRIPFALSEGGETLYLQSAQGEDLTGYFSKEEFGAGATNVSFGRYQKSTGSWNFVPMSSQTKGTANAYPKVGPVIMTEIMYNPGQLDGDQSYEYIELMNISDQTVRTASWVSTYSSLTEHIEEWIPWQFTDGITYEFPVDMELEPGERILLVKDLQAFNEKYVSVPSGTVIIEWTKGSLDNGGERLQLSMPGDQEYLTDRYYIRLDRVNYNDEDDWSESADGTGKSLTHIQPELDNNNYTNDPVNWTAADPTPGW